NRQRRGSLLRGTLQSPVVLRLVPISLAKVSSEREDYVHAPMRSLICVCSHRSRIDAFLAEGPQAPQFLSSFHALFRFEAIKERFYLDDRIYGFAGVKFVL